MGFKTGSRDVSSKSIEDLIKYNPNSSIVDSRLKTRTSTDSNVKMIPSNDTVVKSNKLNAYDIVVQLDKIKNDSIVVIKQLEHTNNVAKEAESGRVSNELIRNDNELIRISNEDKRQTLFGKMNALNVSLNELKIATEQVKDLANEAASKANLSAVRADNATADSVNSTQICNNATDACVTATKASELAKSQAIEAADNATASGVFADDKANKANQAADRANGNLIEDVSSTIISLAVVENTTYKYGTLASLTITSIPNSNLPSFIYFTSGTTATTFAYPSGMKIRGYSVPVANARYVISIFNNVVTIVKV